MKKRSIAFILCITILFSIAAHIIPGVYAEEKSVSVQYQGETISDILLQQDEKKTLTASVTGFEPETYQWQILADTENSAWVNIYDRTQSECEISYALVQNLLDMADSTYLRCAVTTGEKSYYSDAVCVSVAPLQDNSMQLSDSQIASVTVNSTDDTPSEPSVSAGSVRTFSLASRAAVSLLAEGEKEYVTITIQYLDESSLDPDNPDAAIYSPYTATLEKGSPFSENVISPTFLGFAPYYDADGDGVVEDDEHASTITLSYTAVETDVVIKVYYKPIDVNYAIRYFFQNINDDLYTEDTGRYFSGQAKTGSIISNELLLAHAGDTTGFEKLYHYPESISADGSTVFECYYDRNYYLIQFDLNGGYGVDPIYARYGSPFIVNNPIRHGYNFVGWDLLVDTDSDGIPDKGDGIAEADFPTTIPAGNRYYRALWETVNTTATVVYWLEDPDKSGEYNYWGQL